MTTNRLGRSQPIIHVYHFSPVDVLVVMVVDDSSEILSIECYRLVSSVHYL